MSPRCSRCQSRRSRRCAARPSGCSLALACDFVVAADNGFGQIFARRALSLDSGGSWLLPRLVGIRQAKRLALLAETINAEEALEVGLITSVVREAELDKVLAELAGRLAAGSSTALSFSKSLLNSSYSSTFGEALEQEALAQAINFQSSDFREAVGAFRRAAGPKFA